MANLPHFSPPVTLVASGPPHWAQSPGSISYQLRKRWEALSWQKTEYYTASPKTAAYLGLAIPRLENEKLAHDAALGAVAFHYLRKHPEEARMWQGEDLMAHTRIDELGFREKLPDAFLVDDKERVLKVIELGTRYYDSVRIRAFIHDNEQRNDLPWEIWT